VQVGCSVCRRGNLLFPLFAMVRQTDGLPSQDGQSTMFDFDYHLFRDGVEIPQTPVQGIPAFTVPAEKGSYRLTADGVQTSAAWTFTSAEPAKNTVQPGHYCAASSTDPCSPEQLVYVSYDLGTSLDSDNAVPAGRVHTFTVDAYHGPTTAKTPAIAGLKLWASVDNGAHWMTVPVRHNRDGSYTATARYPSPPRNSKGTVSLKAQAWDTAGSTIAQTTSGAFTLRGK